MNGERQAQPKRVLDIQSRMPDGRTAGVSSSLSARGPARHSAAVNIRTPLSARTVGSATGAADALHSGGSQTARSALSRAVVPPGASSSSATKVKRSPSELIAQSRQLGLVRFSEDVQPKIIEFLNLSNFSHNTDSVVPVGEPLFKPTPGVIAFSDFEGLQTYDATLSLRNQDNVARRIKLLPPDSSFFEVMPGKGRKNSSSGDKVAPGMEVSYVIRFKPDARVDYSYDLVVITEREKFIVPIRATGGSAIIEFPDSIEFGVTPVKYESRKTVLVRNIGDKPSKFLLKTMPPFSTSVLDGYLEVESGMQVDVLFKPDCAEEYEGELLLMYGDGMEAYVSLRGAAENVEIAFSQSRLAMSDTFIALSTQSTIMIHNHSDVPIDFSWRAFPTIEEEIGQKLKLQVQLKAEESEECGALMQLQAEEDYYSDEDSAGGTPSSEGSNEDQERQEQHKVQGALQRRYRNIAKAIMEDPMFFYDEIFAVEPLSGRIWAKSKAMITVTFTPKAALTYQCTAYCSIVGQADRMPLLLKGQGIGPKAAFSYDELDVGDVFVESMHQYEVDLINQGDIAVNFQLVHNPSPFGSKFKFTPSHSRLEVGSSVTITVKFCPDLLGEFHETFYWDLVGSASSIPLTFKGHSVSPTFHFDVDRISFGVVSYGFLNSKTLTLTNTSEVPMRFALRIPGDGRFLQKEFDVIPPRGMLLPNCSQKVQIDFISVNVKTYDLCLVVDLDGVGQELASIPIQARCAVPMVSFEPMEMLEYNDVFIRYPAHQTLVLHNTSALPAKFQILPQDEQTRMLAEFEPDQSYGSVPPASSHVVTLTLTSKKIGPLQIPLSCRILGHNLPHQIMLTANSIGPIVNVDPAIVDWGTIRCLEQITRYVKVTNDSVIDATVRAFMKSKNSLWTIEPKSIQLKPHETVQLALTLTIDETVKMSDLMHLVVQEGKDITVTVRAKGTDTPVTCKESLEIIDFGTQYTTQTITREVLIENRGRQPRKLVWVSETEGAKKPKKSNPDDEPDEEPPIFSVVPDSIMLKGKCAYRFQFNAVCPLPGKVSERLVCQEFCGNERKGKTVFTSELKGDFVAPLLELSTSTISFKYMWEKHVPICPMSQQLNIVNVSPLDVRFYVKVQPPFNVNIESLFLRPQESTEIRVEFDPGFKVDHVCGVVKQKLTLIYQDHPQKDYVNLIGEVIFPNVILSEDKVDFGSVLNETTKQLSITISNPNPLPVNYQWLFLEEQEMNPNDFIRQQSMMDESVAGSVSAGTPIIQSALNTQASSFGPRIERVHPDDAAGHSLTGSNFMGTGTLATSQPANSGGFGPAASGGFGTQASVTGGKTASDWASGNKKIDINRIFDILPIMGRLETGETQTITFTYFGLNNQKFEATAVCQVEGGPEYEVALKGQASRLEFRIDKTELDFGDVPFNQVFERDIYLSNTGKVAYYYNFNLSGVSRPAVLDASPLTGLINADEKQKITIRFRAGIPDEVCETAHVEVAHFEPTKLVVRGRGTFPGVLLSTFGNDGLALQLQRQDEEDYSRRRDMAIERLKDVPDSSALPEEPLPDRRNSSKLATQSGTSPVPPGPPGSTGAASVAGALTDGESGGATKAILDDQAVRVEFEVDRNFLCEALLEKERELVQANRERMANKVQASMKSSAYSSSKGMGGSRAMKELPPMTAAYYVCDFGHIVLGQSGTKRISIYNCYDEPVSFTVNRKMLLQAGFTITPEKTKNLPANKSQPLTLTCFRPKDSDEGRQELDWVIPIKGGPSYEVKLISNFVLPDLVLTPEVVDFGRVLVGQRKRVTVRLKNVKAVRVEWEYKAPRSKYGKPLPPWEVVFTLSPSNGKLEPGETTWVTISFTPNSTKTFNQKLALRISDNPNKKLVSLHGQGDALRVEMLPSTVFKLGPILPEESCTQEFFLHNPTDYPIEVYSVEFDQKYVEEEESLREYSKYDSWNLCELPLRTPGEGTWPEVVEEYAKIKQAREKEQRRKEQEELRQEAIERGEEPPEIEAEEEEEAAEEEEEDAQSLSPEMDPANYPIRVATEDRVNVLLMGPPLCGKATVAEAEAKREGRKVLQIDEAIDWALSGPPSMQSRQDKRVRENLQAAVTAFFEEHEAREAEREEECKKKKQSFRKMAPTSFPLAVADVVHVLKKRTEMPDCNCGVIFPNLTGRYLNKEKTFEAIFTAFKEEKFKVLVPSLGDYLGFVTQEAVPIGEGTPQMEKLSNLDEEMEQSMEEFTTHVRDYFTKFREVFEGRLQDVEARLQQARESREALGEEPEEVEPPAEDAADQAPDITRSATMLPEEAEIRTQRKALDQQIAELQEELQMNQRALTRVNEAVGDKNTEEIAFAVKDELVMMEEIAAKILKGQREQKRREVEQTQRRSSKKGSAPMKFVPPERPEGEAAPGISDEEAAAGAAPAAGETTTSALEDLLPSGISLVPLGLDDHFGPSPFESLRATVEALIPAPLIPDEVPLPPPSFAQLVSRPQTRPPRAVPENFSLLSPPPQEADGLEDEPAEGDEKAAPDAEGADEAAMAQTRWLIEPKGNRRLLLKFSAKEIGTFNSTMTFEVVGGNKGNEPTTLLATGVTAFPAINSDPRNVFMRRVKMKPASGYASKQYVTSLGIYDFGPLLAGRDPSTRQLTAQEDPHVQHHIEKFRITNNSLFKAKVQFSLQSSGSESPDEGGGKKDKKDKGGKEDKEEKLNEEYPFIIEPKELELEIDETQEIRVSCFPVREGTYSDAVVATVEHNPEPVEFPISAIGSMPKVNLETEEVDFDRLLLKQRATNFLKFSNVCAVPVKWRLHPMSEEGVPETFTIDAMEGSLAVGEERNVAVTFRAEEPETYTFNLCLQVGDNEGLRPLVDTKEIEVKAEAFNVDVVPEFPHEGRGIDFGDIQVGSMVEQKFTVTNQGKYDVTYEVRVRRKVIRELLEIDMKLDDGVARLTPGDKKTVTLRCKPTHEMQCPEAHRLGRNEELELLVFEARSGEQVRLDLPPISLSFRAIYSSFSVTPPRGLNFGPVQMGESGTRDFEIYNDGVFKFDWFLFDPLRPTSGEKEKRRPEKGELVVGPFRIRPAEGSLNPKESAKIEAKFVAGSDGDFDCKFGFHVDGMPEMPMDRMQGTRMSTDPLEQNTQQNFFSPIAPGVRAESAFREYLLTAHGCTPGIDTENMSTIFEEQFVARNLEDAIATAGRTDIRTFTEDDRVFSFGPVVVQGPSSESQNVDADKFRITNPKAIPCDVKFEIKPRGANKDACPFELSTSQLHIPPHEYRYVKVRFKPQSLMIYYATFEATVTDGKDPKTNLLQFELQGEGTVPTVSIDGPPVFGDTGGECNFGRLSVGQSHTIDFMLRNNGIIPATARCEYKASPHFTVICPKTVPLEPKASHPLQVRFHPRESGDFNVPVRIHTLYNQFEDTTIQFKGEGYIDEVSWDLQDVPRAPPTEETANQAHLPPAPDELYLGEVPLGGEATVTFYVSNNFKDPIRFSFPETLPPPFTDCLRITPSVGHVLPRTRKPITFAFRPTEKIEEQVVLQASISSIAYDGEPEDWDDSMRAVSFTPRAGQSPGRQSSSRQGSKQSVSAAAEFSEVVVEEPAHHILEDTTRELPLKVSAIADDRVYECDTQRIFFKTAVMFQTKVHRFTVNNPSRISLSYDWQIMMADGGKGPGLHAYSITPKQGTVAAGSNQEFTVRFSPREVEEFDCRMECQIQQLSQECQPLSIELNASAIRPWCHFELPTSDYRTRRHADAPLDPKYQILEFESLGTRVKNTKRFYVLNPTSENYDFVWLPEEVDRKGDQDDAFRCLTKRGTIFSGKKYEMVFEYLPTSVGTHESFWNFSVVNKEARQSFLVVGTVKEPRIGMDCPNVNFNRLLLGARARETVHIVNKEHIPFSFSFSRSSFETEGQVPVLAVSPNSGVVGPGASCPVEVTFTPIEEKFYNFNVLCNVKRREKPIVLNVKGEGYKIHTKLVIEEKEQGDRELHAGVRELLDFGNLQVQESRSFTLRLSSPGFQRDQKRVEDAESEEMPTVNFDFIWQLRSMRGGVLIPRADAPPYLTVSPMQGVAKQDEETIITITYCPLDTHALDGTALRMLIPSGPGEASHNLELVGRARRPNVDFSVTSHDFGPCFVSKVGITASEPSSPSRGNMPYERLDLIVMNRDNTDCWLSTTFHRCSWLDVQLATSMIEAGQSLSVPIIFTPREYVEYRERVEFVINDCMKYYVNIRGSGCQLHLELVSMSMQNVDFGVTVGNQPVSQTAKVVNRSQRPVDFILHDPDSQLFERCVSWSPTQPVSLRPKEQLTVDLRFTPSYRIAPFKLPLYAQCNFGQEVHLLNVSGSCHTAEVKLSEHSVLFGDVVFHSTAVRKVHLHNFGDLGVKFRFEMPAKVAALFSVEPNEGFASPHDDVVLQVKFHPPPPSGAGREQDAVLGKPKRIRCYLDPSYQQDPVELIVQGRGIDQLDSSVKLLEFSAEVRDSQKLSCNFPPEPMLKNPTSEPWKLNPVVKTEIPPGVSYWFVPQEINVPPGGNTSFEITYRPLTMTAQEEDVAADLDDQAALAKKPSKKPFSPAVKHIGKVFIATPDGNAFVYNLEGTSLPPKEAKRIFAEVQCKKPHTQAVEVSNWLNEAQRFHVSVTLIEPPDAREEIKLHGVETFDLPPGVLKEYKFNVYAYREGSAKAKVVFTNPKTGEFLTIEVAFKFVAPDMLQVIEFSTAVRQVASHPISVVNPLSTPVNFKCEASIPEIRFSPQDFVVPPNSEASVDVQFRPVLAGSGEATLKLSSAELGNYPYDVRYETKPAGLDKTIVFKAPLGSSETVQSFKFLHYAQKPAQYSASIESAPGHSSPASHFTVETKDIKANAATEEPVEVVVDIRFSPSQLGEMRALLVLTSPDGGDYKALLVGYTQPPQPQGPVIIQSGKSGNVDFQNPFEEAVQFNVQIDNPNFTVASRAFKLDGKKSAQITINFKSDKPQGGRLIVSAPKVSNPWVYFLKGTL